MKRNKRKKNVTWQSGSLTTSSLLNKMFAEYGLNLIECDKDQCYRFLLETENGEIENIFFEPFNEFSFIRIMVFQWHEVKMADVEEVTRVKSAISEFNSRSRAKVYYHVTGDVMKLSTILHCSFCEGIPDIGGYLVAQIDTVRDAREFIFPSDEQKGLPWHDIYVPAQSKINKDIVVDSLKELDCKPDVEDYSDNYDSITFDYQTESFEIRAKPTSGFVLLWTDDWYRFDATNVEKLSIVERIVNELNWDSKTNVVYWIDEGICRVASKAFMTCVEGMDFTQSLYVMLVNNFHARNMFEKKLAESLEWYELYDSNIINNYSPDFASPGLKCDDVINALNNIQCNVVMMPSGRHTQWLGFWFQAVLFEVYIKNPAKTITILDRSFYDFCDDKTGKKEIVRDIVNKINSKTPLTVTYSEHKGQIVVGSKYVLPCMEYGRFNDLLKYILYEFFYVRNSFYSLIAKNKVQHTNGDY